MELGPEALRDVESITAADFVGGVLHQLAKRSPSQKFSFDTRDRRLHAAFAATFRHLRDHADDTGQPLDFEIYPDRFHGDSITVSDELRDLLFHGPIEGYGSYVTLTYDANDPRADLIAEYTTGSPELYAELADFFTAAYDTSATSA